ncbi:hypothetical protein [Paenibacillus donghaensis]|uniref:hypothetical protein n=1 Tax=Paenibacillus donghaensis TaxID=414771 RepID=UPI0012F7A9BF|nr:hypothetical protein [Paenibacillus donghaensis]
MELIFAGLWLLSLFVFVLVIRNAIDGSKTSRKLDLLVQEIRLLRKEIKDNKHIIDKKV